MPRVPFEVSLKMCRFSYHKVQYIIYLPKMFCNETCESLAHEDKKTALVKKEANKAVAAKKKNAQKVKNWKNTDSGQFWWHDQ